MIGYYFLEATRTMTRWESINVKHPSRHGLSGATKATTSNFTLTTILVRYYLPYLLTTLTAARPCFRLPSPFRTSKIRDDASLGQHPPIGRTADEPPRRAGDPPPLSRYPRDRASRRDAGSVRRGGHVEQPPGAAREFPPVGEVELPVSGGERHRLRRREESEAERSRSEDSYIDGERGEGVERHFGSGRGMSQAGVPEFGGESRNE